MSTYRAELAQAQRRLAKLQAQLRELDVPPRRPDRVGPTVLGMAVLPVLAGLGWYAMTLFVHFSGPPLTPAPQTPEPVMPAVTVQERIGGTWYRERSASPWLVDVNGDGTKDLLGVAWLHRGSIAVVAYDGVTFDRIWSSAPMPGTWSSDITHLVVVGNKVVVSDAADTVRVLSAQSGGAEQEVESKGGVWAICANPKTPTSVVLATRPYGAESARLDLSTGVLASAATGARCTHWNNDNRPDERQTGRSDESIHKKSKVRGFEGTDTYGYGDYRVTIGGVYGDGVPPRAGLHMLGWEQGSRSLRWEHALLPEGDESRDRTHMVVDEDTVNYSYQTNHTPKLGPHRLVAWSIMTGEQRWKATLPESAEGSMVTYLGLGSGHLFVQLDQHLLIIDTKSGAVQKDLDNL